MRYLLFCFSLFYISCTNDDKPLSLFSEVETLNKYEILDLEKYNILDISNFYKINNSFLVISQKDSLNLTLIDINTNNYIKGIPKGRGPLEATSLVFAGIQDSIAYFYDVNLMKIFEINVDRSIKEKKIIANTTDLPYRFIRAFINSKYIVGSCWPPSEEPVRFMLYNRLNNKHSLYENFPQYLDKFSNFHKFLAEVQTNVISHPKSNKFISYNMLGGMYSIWQIENDEIKLYKDYTFHLPQLYLKNDNVFPQENNKNGFRNMCTSEKYIIGSWEGQTYEESKKDYFGLKHLLVFDWEGIPIKHYILPLKMIVTCYDEGENMIYGLNYENETRIIKYKLNLD